MTLAATTLDRIDRLRAFGLHEILFRNAGVGLKFYVGDYDEEGQPADNWREQLRVNSFYPSLIEAVDAEYERVVEES